MTQQPPVDGMTQLMSKLTPDEKQELAELLYKVREAEIALSRVRLDHQELVVGLQRKYKAY